MWQAAGSGSSRRPAVDEARWVVLDVESSGLDVRRDRLLAIAALGVHLDADRAASSRRRQLRGSCCASRRSRPRRTRRTSCCTASASARSARASTRREALASFAAWVGAAPLVAFHAAFDRAMLDRACRSDGRPPLPDAWLDLAPLATVLHPEVRATVARRLAGALRHRLRDAAPGRIGHARHGRAAAAPVAGAVAPGGAAGLPRDAGADRRAPLAARLAPPARRRQAL